MGDTPTYEQLTDAVAKLQDKLREQSVELARLHSGRDELKHMRAWRAAIGHACTESDFDALIDALGSSDTGAAAKLRDEVGELLIEAASLREEAGKLRDLRHRDHVDNREFRENVERVAKEDMQRRTRDYAVMALRHLTDSLKGLARIAEKELPFGHPVRNAAARVLGELDREVDPDSPHRVLADMQAAHERLVAEKTALWNTLSRHGLLGDLDEARHG